MRRWNAILTAAIMLLFLVHMICGGFQLAGLLPGGIGWLSALTWLMTALIGIHTAIGCALTAQTLRAVRRSGVHYFKENRMFWVRRISGFALMLLLLCHAVIFTAEKRGSAVRLHEFGTVQLILQILLVLGAAVHVLTNIKPLLLALGARGFREIFADILLILSVLLILAAAAFGIYFLRWQQ